MNFRPFLLALLVLPPAGAQAQDAAPPPAPRSFAALSLAYSQSYGQTLGLELYLDDVLAENTTLKLAGSKDRRGYSLQSSFSLDADRAPPAFPGWPVFSFELTADAHAEPGSAYDTALYGGAVHADWAVGGHGSLRASYTITQSTLSGVAASTSPLIAAEAGREYASGLVFSYGFDTTDDPVLARSGSYLTTTGQADGLGGDARWGAVSVAAGIALPVGARGAFSLDAGAGYSMGFGGYEMRVIDRAMLGGDSPRGFAFGGIGPADTDGTTVTHLGGQQFATLSAAVKTPLMDIGQGQLIGHAFADAGSVWGLSRTAGGFLPLIDDAPFLNTSVGVGLSWSGPFGVLSVSYAQPLTSRATDALQPFQLGFQTRF